MGSFDGQAYLNTFLNWESQLQKAVSGDFLLDRMERLLVVFGRPQDKLRFAHVAGTKGKGSTCAFLASILSCAGYRAGLYTSPHLHSVCERIQIGFSPIVWEEFEDILRYFHDDIQQLRAQGVEVTFYELLTAVAMHYFASKKVDLVVLETGLGGRLDATNVFDTSVCGITPIGFDHTSILGNTLTAIAAEKAGIIKSPDQRVSVSPQLKEALNVIKARCRVFGIHPLSVGSEIPYKIHRMDEQGLLFDVEGRRRYAMLASPLIGKHQAENAALAVAMAEDLETFGFVIDELAVTKGIANVRWPARFQKMADHPTVIIDGAHTIESAKALCDTFYAVYPGKKAVVVVGMSQDKDAQAFLKALAPMTGHLILTQANHPRAKDWGNAPEAVLPLARALEKARTIAGADGMIVVTGSLFICADVLKNFNV